MQWVQHLHLHLYSHLFFLSYAHQLTLCMLASRNHAGVVILGLLSSSHVFSLPLSGLNWRSLFPPRGSGPSFPNMAAPFTGSAHTPLPGSGTDTFRPLLEISNIFVLILSCLTYVVLHQQDHPLYCIIILTILKNGPITPFWAKDKTYLTTLSSLTLETFLHAFSLFLPTQGWEWGTKLGQVLPYPLSPAWGHGTRERQYMGLLLYLHAGFTPPPHLFTGWHGTIYLVRSSVHANAKVRMWDMGQPLQTTLVWNGSAILLQLSLHYIMHCEKNLCIFLVYRWKYWITNESLFYLDEVELFHIQISMRTGKSVQCLFISHRLQIFCIFN